MEVGGGEQGAPDRTPQGKPSWSTGTQRNGITNMNDELFQTETIALDSPKLRWVKRLKAVECVKTHRSEIMTNAPWMALLPRMKDRDRDIGAIMADSCRLYDEAGLIGYGDTEVEAIIDLCVNVKIPLWNEENT